MTPLIDVYRRTGADAPWGNSLAPHDVAMEGWFWRVTDTANARVAVVLCGRCRGPRGEWTLVGLAAEPGGLLRSAICPPLEVGDGGRSLRTPDDSLSAHADELHVALGDDARLDATLTAPVGWSRRRAYGALGLGHGVPSLGQYWHPHVLGARVDGRMRLGDSDWRFDGATGYAEKNWGTGFPARWWWGQASGVGDHEDACVAFAGGDVRLGPVALSPTAIVVRLGDELLRLAPPFALVHSGGDERSWQLRARSPRVTVEIEGDANGNEPHQLPVPVAGERRVIEGAAHHFTGRLDLTVRRGRRLVFKGESTLAALERGDLTGKLDAVGEAALVAELLEVGVEGHAGGDPQDGGLVERDV
jgi:tocopherol cyclase